jgi:transglutaminase-like putative cysteine protease
MSVIDEDLEALEGRILEHLDEVSDVEGDIDAAAAAADASAAAQGFVEPPLPPLRTGLVVAAPSIAAGVMLSGLFEGAAGRVAPALAALCGIATAAQASRRKSALWANATIVLGILGTAFVLVLPTGIDNITGLGSIISEAKGASKVLRPPAEFLPGWRFILGFVMATVGFAAGWVAIELRRPALGLLLPLPAVAYGAISVPESQKLVSGIIAAVLFIIGLALLASLQGLVDGAESAPGLRYELKRTARAIPLLAAIVAGLFLLAQSDLLFPKPRFDPTRDSVTPKAVPLSEVKDRPLFTVASAVTGPWRIGMLDVYKDDEWRLPAFAESTLKRVPKTGIVDLDLRPEVTAEFVIADLGGAVLPGLPNTSAIEASGPRLAYDARTGNIRLAQGQIRAGLRYTVGAPALPTEDDLRKENGPPPADVQRNLEIPDPPPEIVALLAEAPPNKWDRMDYLRRRLLQTTVAAGPGIPKPVSPGRVVDMLTGSKEGTPYEIVAAQAMLARWAGVPSRIGYGFDGGEVIDGGLRQIRPRNGSSWLEVYFPGFKWLPVLGSPAKAKATLQPDGPTVENPEVQPSTDIAVQVYFPLRTTSKSPWFSQVARIMLFLTPLLLVLALLYLLWPAAWKAIRRVILRRRIASQDVVARVALSYAEFRDLCTDLGLRGRCLSPLAFLDVIVDDEEHRELAWLVTRVVWGDLRRDRAEDQALDAAELARVLKRRVAQAQPVSIRLIAQVSRLSMRQPYAPELHRRGAELESHHKEASNAPAA